VAGFKSTYLCNKLLDHWLGASSFTAPVTVYVALFTVAPTAAGGGTEVSGGSYARVAKTNNLTNFPAAASAQKKNGTVIDFGTATADWGTVIGAALFDASSGGNLLAYGPFGTAVTVLNGGAFSIPVNGGTFTEA
jgi:hypothetical protein